MSVHHRTFSQRTQHVLFPCRAQEVDNNLQIYSRQICSRRWQTRASWKARHPAVSYFINYNEGYTALSLNIHETQPTPSCLYSGDRPNLFTPTPSLARFAEGVNYVQNLRRDAKIIISVHIAAVTFNANYSI